MTVINRGKVQQIKGKVAPRWVAFFQDPKNNPKPSGTKAKDLQEFAAAVLLKAIDNALENGGSNIATNMTSSSIIVTLTSNGGEEYTLACTGSGWPPNASMVFDNNTP